MIKPIINQGRNLNEKFIPFLFLCLFLAKLSNNATGPNNNILSNLTWVAINPDSLLTINEAAITWGTAYIDIPAIMPYW